MVAEVLHQLDQRRPKTQRLKVEGTQRKDCAAQIDDGVGDDGLQFIQRCVHAWRSRFSQMGPKCRLKTQAGQALRHTIVNLVGDAAAFGINGLRLVATLCFGADVFNRDDHLAVIRRIERCDHAYCKERAVSMPAGCLNPLNAALLNLLDDAQNGRFDLCGRQLGSRHSCQLGGRIAEYQLCLPVGFQNDCRCCAQVDDEDTDGRVVEQMAVAPVAELV